MSGLFGPIGGKPIAVQAQRANGLQIQASDYGKALPIVYGRTRIPAVLIWYGDFQAVEHQQQIGKGGGNVTTSYTYSASFALALCEGPIQKIGTIWDGSGTVALSDINGTLMTGAAGQSSWSHWSGSEALNYPYVAYVGCLNLKLGATPNTPNLNWEVYGLLPFNATGGIYDAEPSAIITDLLTNPQHGADFTYLGDLTQYRNYCTASGLFISPALDTERSLSEWLRDLLTVTNSTALWSDGKLTFIPYGDQQITGNGVTYTPQTVPVALLGIDDFLHPVRIERKPLADMHNVVRLEFLDYSNNYVTSVVQVQDQADIDLRGVRSEQTITAHAITNSTLAMQVAQTILQRNLYIRNTYAFSLGLTHIALMPGDIVTLTDPLLGLNQEPARIISMKEGSDLTLEVTAEEFPAGVATGAQYATEASNGYIPNVHGAPDATQTPVFFRAPQFLVDRPEIWMGVAGGGPNWGGAHVWVSYDNSHYTHVGTVYPGCRYGVLSTPLSTGSDPDTVNSFGVELYGPGQLNGGTQQDADELVTLMLVDQELISYKTTTLNSDGTYTLGNGYLRRGAYNTTIASHAVGAPWLRIDAHIFRWPFAPGDAGKTIYIKFQAFNLYGGGAQDLSTINPYTYVIGAAEDVPDQPPVPTNFVVAPVADGIKLTWAHPNPAAVAMTSIERSPDGTMWNVIGQVQGEFYTDHFPDGSSYYYRVRARSKDFLWSDYTSAQSATGKVVPASGALPNVLGTTANFNVTAADWYEIALTDNSQYADYRCGFSATATVLNGAGQGTCEFRVTSNGDGSKAALTLVHGSPGIPITQARVRAVDTTHVALDIYVNWTSGTINVQIAVAPITGAWNGASAQAGLSAGAGTVLQTLNMDPNATGSHGGGIGHIGTGGKWHLLLDSGDVWHGGGHVLDPNQRYVPGLDSVLDTPGGVYQRMPASNMDGNRRALIDFTQSGHLSKNLDYIGDSGNFRKVSSTYVDASNRPYQLHRATGGIDVSADLLTQQTEVTNHIGGQNVSTIDFAQKVTGRTADRVTYTLGGDTVDSRDAGGGKFTHTAMSSATQTAVDGSGNVQNVYGKSAATIKSQSDTWLDPRGTGSHIVDSTSNYGWMQIVEVSGTANGRGAYEVELSNNGGGVPPFRVRLAVHVDWTNHGALQMVASSVPAGGNLSSAVDGIALTYDASGNTYLWAHCPAAPANTTWTLNSRVIWNPESLASTISTGITNVSNNPFSSPPSGHTVIAAINCASNPILASSTGPSLQTIHATSAGGITNAGSGIRVGDGRNLIALNSAGYATSYVSSGGAYSETYNSGDNTYSVTMAAFTLAVGSAAINYNSWTSPHLTPATTYYFALNDPGYGGGSPSLVYSTSKQALIQDGYIYVGSYTTGASGGGGGGGGGAPTGCVALDQYLAPGLPASRARIGAWLDGAAGVRLTGRCRITAVHTLTAPCVRIVSANGCALVCSEDTPFTLPDGSALAKDMQGKMVLTDLGPAEVVSVTSAGSRPVVRISREGNESYAAGEQPHRRIYSHNTVKP